MRHALAMYFLLWLEVLTAVTGHPLPWMSYIGINLVVIMLVVPMIMLGHAHSST